MIFILEIPSSCSDGVLNGKETAIDCGGECTGCAVGSVCSGNADCDRSTCQSGKCTRMYYLVTFRIGI